jgi:predicted PurR-regulated permease PerM
MALPSENAKPPWILTLASIAVVIAAVYLAKGVLVPLTLAVLLSFLLSPLCDWLERRRLGRIPAVLVTAFLGFTLLGIAAWTTADQMTRLAPKIPEYRTNLEAKLKSVKQYGVAALSKVTSTAVEGMGQELLPTEPVGEPKGTAELPYSVRVLSAPTSPLQLFGGMFGTLLEVLGTSGIVIVLVVYFLVRREDLRDRFIHLIGKGHVTMTTQVLEYAAKRVSRYLSVLFFINATFGISVGIGLYFIGVPNPVLWGIMAAALRFIPYIGPWIAAAMPIALSLAISPGWLAPCLAVGLFVVLELLSNNVLEPWLYGKNTGVSAVAVLLAAVFWMWLWGPVGLLLATPLTVCLLVVGKHVPQLSFLGILLGTEPVFEPKTRIYQRLLAGDLEEATELFESYLEHQPLAEVYDTVLIPALALTEMHWQLGELNDVKHKFILEGLKEIIQDRGERQLLQQPEKVTPIATGQDSIRLSAAPLPRVTILCLPARTEADEITALMLAQVLGSAPEAADCLVEAISATSLAGEMVELLERRKPDVICISATPPAAVMHARYLCKRVYERFPKVRLLVGLWDAQGELSKSKARIGCDATVVATMANALKQLDLLTAPHSSSPEKPEQAGHSRLAPTGTG